MDKYKFYGEIIVHCLLRYNLPENDDKATLRNKHTLPCVDRMLMRYFTFHNKLHCNVS